MKARQAWKIIRKHGGTTYRYATLRRALRKMASWPMRHRPRMTRRNFYRQLTAEYVRVNLARGDING